MTGPPSLARLRHDLKNQLGIVLGFSEMLLSELDATDPRGDGIREIARAARRAVDLVAAMAPADEGKP